jgi:sugar (pentulose or hexulose) kinase
LRDADDGRVASAGLATHRRASAAHVARAAVEGVACSVLDAVDALQTAQALRGDGSC